VAVESIARTLCAFLGTYLVHSTLLLCAAWLACALLARHGSRAGALREGLWRTALFGAIATSVLALCVPGLGARIAWPALDEQLVPLAALRSAPHALHSAMALVTSPPPAVHAPLFALSVPDWLALAWTLGAGLAAARLARGWLEQRRALLNSRRVSDPRALALLAELCGSEAAPDLRTTSSIGAPITCGWLWPAILLPARALDELGESELCALLAHELGHVQRSDALWLTLYGAISTLFFFQPLNRLARARLAHEAEFACDDAAIARGAERLGLARCLTEVAGWLVRGREREHLPEPSMAARGKSLTSASNACSTTRTIRCRSGACAARCRSAWRRSPP
jgi:Zn-dependent protease with chaperone function